MAEKPSSKKLAAAPAATKAAAAKAGPAPVAKPAAKSAPMAAAAAPRATSSGAATATAPAKAGAPAAAKVDPKERSRLVAEAAYYRALKRGFAPGHEVQDWIAAEKDVDARLGK